MLSTSVAPVVRESLTKRLAKMAEDYAKLSETWTFTISEVDRARMGRQLEAMKKDMETLDEQIVQVGAVQETARQRDLRWRKHLPRLDFTPAVAAFGKVQARFRDEGGFAFYLLQNG